MSGTADFDRRNAPLRSRVVRVKREQGEGGYFYATSPDLKGLLVAQPTLDELDRAVTRAITDLYTACGEGVVVTRATRAEQSEAGLHAWVATPIEAARKALEERALAPHE